MTDREKRDTAHEGHRDPALDERADPGTLYGEEDGYEEDANRDDVPHRSPGGVPGGAQDEASLDADRKGD